MKIQILIQYIFIGPETVFLTISQLLWLLLVYGPHQEVTSY